ncbi:MAG: hypothetical protein KC776_36110 [Myxococcales bacterium]|nr:hypothetical protein [Myxococcales bacterium]MCB9577889.1 hypothetical protein [Polyangiaceae bacterium]
MDGSRSTTSLAILAGAVLGALAAILGPSPPPTPTSASARPFQPVSQVAAPRTTSAGPTETAATVTLPPPPPPAPSAPPAMSKDAIETAALGCARGDGAACLRAATGRAQSGADDRAELLRKLAVQRFAADCQSRKPEACSELARLYRDGVGVSASTTTADALDERVRSLCRARPSDFCKSVD